MPASGRAAAESRPDWPGYYEATADRPPRRTTLTALAGLRSGPGPDSAATVDLGCGGGRDTAPLLEAGLAVLALDKAPEAGTALQARFPTAWNRGQLTFRQADLSAEDLRLPPSGLVNASFCLPLCPPDRFDGLWLRIARAVVPGGLFAGHLYGPNDSWAQRGDGLTIHGRDDVDTRFADWELLLIDEEETDSITPRGEAKHWHVFHIVARNPA